RGENPPAYRLGGGAGGRREPQVGDDLQTHEDERRPEEHGREEKARRGRRRRQRGPHAGDITHISSRVKAASAALRSPPLGPTPISWVVQAGAHAPYPGFP